MAHVLDSGTAGPGRELRVAHPIRLPAYQAYLILYVGFIALPIVAGVDKFFDLIGKWDAYLAPVVVQHLPVAPHTFMMEVGVIEIIAGLIVLVRPQIGAYVVALWLLGIIVNLLIGNPPYDVALRDFGLLLGALALGRLSQEFGSVLRFGK